MAFKETEGTGAKWRLDGRPDLAITELHFSRVLKRTWQPPAPRGTAQTGPFTFIRMTSLLSEIRPQHADATRKPDRQRGSHPTVRAVRVAVPLLPGLDTRLLSE